MGAHAKRAGKRDDADLLARDERLCGVAFMTLDGRRVDPDSIEPVYADGHAG